MIYDIRKVKVRVSIVVVCNEDGMYELVFVEFIFKIKVRSMEVDICSLEEVVNIVKCCFYLNIDNKVNEFKLK